METANISQTWSGNGCSVVQNAGMVVVLSMTGATSATWLNVGNVLAPTHIEDRNAEFGNLEFLRSVEAWKNECRKSPSSRIDELCASAHYRKIIDMGRPVLPLLLREMAERPDHWNLALKAITGENPVPPESEGKLREIVNAWVSWGRTRQLI